MNVLLSDYVPPIREYLSPPKVRPPDWVEEIVTVVQGTKDDEPVCYRLGTLTCKGSWLTGTPPAIAAVWLAEGRVKPGVHAHESVILPEPFIKELASHGFPTKIMVTSPIWCR